MGYTKEELSKLPTKGDFRLRGLEMTRLETFMDAAFAFAITMLVISIDKLPGNYSELINALKGVPAFAASFTIMMLFWTSHRRWSRYYGMEDGGSIFITLLLIFILLVYIYPLKLLFSAMFHWVSGGWLPSEFKLEHWPELINLYVIYGVGLAALASPMALLFQRAKQDRRALGLNQLELALTGLEITTWWTMAFTGITSALFALVMPVSIGRWAGFVYVSFCLTMPYISLRYERKLKSLKNTNAQ